MKTMTKHARCPRCSRLLAPTFQNLLPRHRVPEKRIYGRASVPLTGADAPWCPGR